MSHQRQLLPLRLPTCFNKVIATPSLELEITPISQKHPPITDQNNKNITSIFDNSIVMRVLLSHLETPDTFNLLIMIMCFYQYKTPPLSITREITDLDLSKLPEVFTQSSFVSTVLIQSAPFLRSYTETDPIRLGLILDKSTLGHCKDLHLSDFDFSNLSPDQLYSFLSHTPHLEKLRLTSCTGLTPLQVSQLNKLSELHLLPKPKTYFGSSSFSNDAFQRFLLDNPDLKELHLNYCIQLKTCQLIQLKGLERLELCLMDLSENTEESWKTLVKNNPHLRSLTLSGCNLSGNIPDDLSDLRYLTHLNLSKNRFSSIPDTISNLPALTHLDLGSNWIHALPDNFYLLKTLIHLDLSNNYYKNATITPLLNLLHDSNLEHVDLRHNKHITPIPTEADIQILMDKPKTRPCTIL